MSSMSFSVRVALLAAAAVAIAALGASVLMYFVVQGELVRQVDGTLIDATRGIRDTGGRPFGPPGPFGGPRNPPLLSGRGDIFGQIIDASGNVVRADLDSPIPTLATSEARSVAAGSGGPTFFETDLSGTHVRVYAAPLGNGLAIEFARRLDEIDRVLGETRLRLAAVGLAGVLLAAALGMIVSRAALAPVRRLSGLVEDVARTRDLSARVAAGSSDELGRLADSFNAMLSALDASIRSQRQLVADASHELRTPLTSLRTNLELLERGQPADPAERQQVVADLVGQLERLGTLVGDLIDLARDEEAALPAEDVRLDLVVGEAVDDARQRYPRVRFELEVRPSVVHGVRQRLARAVINLLDNAGKWSPEGGHVEVRVGDREVVVRDHGPGVAPEDAPHVFDRFWRASSARHLPGSGLGLSIVKDVAESSGGSVIVERPEGAGAQFRLRLRPG